MMKTIATEMLKSSDPVLFCFIFLLLASPYFYTMIRERELQQTYVFNKKCHDYVFVKWDYQNIL